MQQLEPSGVAARRRALPHLLFEFPSHANTTVQRVEYNDGIRTS